MFTVIVVLRQQMQRGQGAHEEEAIASLRKLRATEHIEHELDEIRESIKHQRRTQVSKKAEDNTYDRESAGSEGERCPTS